MRKDIFITVLWILLVTSFCGLNSQSPGKGKIAVIQATSLPNQDLFMVDYDPVKVRSGVSVHLDKLLGLFERQGRWGRPCMRAGRYAEYRFLWSLC